MAIADFPYSFASQPIIDPTTGQPVLNATGGVLQDPASGTLLSMADMNGNPITQITGNAYGMSSQFRSTQLAVLVKFGSVYVQAPSIEMFNLVQTTADAVTSAQSAQSLAQAAAASAQAAAASAAGGGSGTPDWTTITNKPTTFTPSSHTHPSGQISDSTPTGRAVVTAADAQSARVAIGAGTGNGTSNLALGTTATTAAAGNHTHTASSVGFTPTGSLTASDVQAAIVQASQSGGGTGTSSVYVWRYSAGGWPTLPTTKPTGVFEVRALGPSYPTSIPTWVGLSAAQIPMSYSLVNVA